MRKGKFSEHQIITILKAVEAGRTIKDVCREHEISDATMIFCPVSQRDQLWSIVQPELDQYAGQAIYRFHFSDVIQEHFLPESKFESKICAQFSLHST